MSAATAAAAAALRCINGVIPTNSAVAKSTDSTGTCASNFNNPAGDYVYYGVAFCIALPHRLCNRVALHIAVQWRRRVCLILQRMLSMLSFMPYILPNLY
jgi:hypothetical protein